MGISTFSPVVPPEVISSCPTVLKSVHRLCVDAIDQKHNYLNFSTNIFGIAIEQYHHRNTTIISPEKQLRVQLRSVMM